MCFHLPIVERSWKRDGRIDFFLKKVNNHLLKVDGVNLLTTKSRLILKFEEGKERGFSPFLRTIKKRKPYRNDFLFFILGLP